ncbi:MAG: hypothetical protein F6K18_23290 [Okeania sp. SIO2C2]|nr:hypothetical protein [Okeania sp. SIO2C2]NEP89519.1 hypothetical protein [Okeania sp. SIO2C2]
MAEAEERGKLKVIPELLKQGFSVEKIANILHLDVRQVQQFINNLN